MIGALFDHVMRARRKAQASTQPATNPITGRSGTIHILASRVSHIALRHAPVPSAALGEFDCVAVGIVCSH
jgi:hypothetical protein